MELILVGGFGKDIGFSRAVVSGKNGGFSR
jgi:hypothetical protein